MSTRLIGRVANPLAGSRVNRDAGTIENVLICGNSSANGRDYPSAMFQRDFRKYEGKPVNCDHSREATVDRRCGWFTNVRVGSDGKPRGTLHLLKSHPIYGRVMEAAERNPALFGFSHVAMCDTRPGPNGREVVEAIREVESIDLVAQPATTASLFESRIVASEVRTPWKEIGFAEWLGLPEGDINQSAGHLDIPERAPARAKQLAEQRRACWGGKTFSEWIR